MIDATVAGFDEDTDGDEQAEEFFSGSGRAGLVVVAHHIVPLPIAVTDSNAERGALVECVRSDMCLMTSVVGCDLEQVQIDT